MRARVLTIFAVAMAVAASPALAAHGKIGLWQITIKADMSGMMTPQQMAKMKAMGMKMPMADGITLQHCMTAAEVAMDHPPAQTGHEKECKVQNLRTSGQSFEADIEVDGIGEDPLRAVFIRAPWVERTGPGVEVLASHGEHPVAIREDGVLATAFHPELTDDSRLHALFMAITTEARKRAHEEAKS